MHNSDEKSLFHANVISHNNEYVNPEIRKLYFKELSVLRKSGFQPLGIYSHLQSFEQFVEWYRKMSDVVGSSVIIKENLW